MGLFDKDPKYQALKKLRDSGYDGPVDRNGNAVASRTDSKGKPLPLFKGGTGHGTKDAERAKKLGKGKR